MPQQGHDTLTIDLDVLEVEPAEDYHARAGEHLSSHALADFIKCPLLYWKKQQGLLPDEDRPAYLVGRAAHTLVLEGIEAFEQTYAVGGPINSKTGRAYGRGTKAFTEWAAAQDKAVLTESQYGLVTNLAASVDAHPFATDLLRCGRAEGVVRTEYCGVPCQSRIDWVHPHRGIVDFKTCDDLTWFEADARRYGYHRQMAFYRAVLARALDGLLVPVHLIAVEKKEPFRCGVWRAGEDTLAIAQSENEAAIRRLVACRERDHWPSGYEEIRVFDVA